MVAGVAAIAAPAARHRDDMSSAQVRSAGATLLQGLALVTLALALAGVRGCSGASQSPELHVLLDRSLSVPRAAADSALAEVRTAFGDASVACVWPAARSASDSCSQCFRGSGPL